MVTPFFLLFETNCLLTNLCFIISYAHTLVGVGCMVVNPQDEVLVVQVSFIAFKPVFRIRIN
jgi:hypothetical protein